VWFSSKRTQHHSHVHGFSPRKILDCPRAIDLATQERRHREPLVYRRVGADANKHGPLTYNSFALEPAPILSNQGRAAAR
jgi:hypothetical protein